VMGLVESFRATGWDRQAANLERKGDLETEHRSCRSIDTPRPARAALERCARRSRVEPPFIAVARSTARVRRRKMRRDTGAGSGLTTWASAADPGLEQRPEVDATRLGVVGQPATETRRQRREVSGHRRGGTARSGEEPRSRNPGRGSRAKQICKVQRGANRRERAKRCGRNAGEPGSSSNRGLAGLTPR
jgi:hypothetical protein